MNFGLCFKDWLERWLPELLSGDANVIRNRNREYFYGFQMNLLSEWQLHYGFMKERMIDGSFCSFSISYCGFILYWLDRFGSRLLLVIMRGLLEIEILFYCIVGWTSELKVFLGIFRFVYRDFLWVYMSESMKEGDLWMILNATSTFIIYLLSCHTKNHLVSI